MRTLIKILILLSVIGTTIYVKRIYDDNYGDIE